METDLWFAEFRGFFWGEGCLDVSLFNRKGNARPSYCPRARIGLNSVDLPLLQDVQRVFGGSLYYRQEVDSWTWQLTGKESLLRLVEHLSVTKLPAHKHRQVAVFREVLETIPGRGRNYTTETRDRLSTLKSELERLKRAA